MEELEQLGRSLSSWGGAGTAGEEREQLWRKQRGGGGMNCK
jgi:hypothetical protein